MKAFTRALLLAGVAAVAAGCAPIWPLGPANTKLPGYPTGTNCEPNCLKNAQDDAIKTEEIFEQAARNIENVKNASVLSLFGLGTTAGVNLVQSGSKRQLQTLGLWAVGIAGLSEALATDKQHETFSAGATAVACLIKVDAELDAAHDNITQLDVERARVAAAADRAEAERAGVRPDAERVLELDANTISGFAINVRPQRPVEQLSGLSALAVINAVTANNAAPSANGRVQRNAAANAQPLAALGSVALIEAFADSRHAAAADQRLRDALAEVHDNPTQRAQNLNKAVNDVKAAVRDRLYAGADLSKIFDAMKDGMKKTAGKSDDAQHNAQDLSDKAKTKGAAVLENAITVASARTRVNATVREDAIRSLQKVRDTGNEAGRDAGAAEGVADTFDTCLAHVQPKDNGGGNSDSAHRGG